MQLLVFNSMAGSLAAGIQCIVAYHIAVNFNKRIKQFVHK